MRSLPPVLASLFAIAVLSAGSAQAQADKAIPVETFAIDATEVTIGAFRAFAEANELTTEAERAGGGFEWGAGWERRPGWTVYTPYGAPAVSDNEPAVHVSWDEARAYCAWQNGRLPTSSEWQLAAYRETRAPSTDGFKAGRTYSYSVGDRPEGMNINGTDPCRVHAVVGSTRKGVNGLFDMGGNVWEWLADRRGDDALTAGGSWWYGAEQTKAEAMQWKPSEFYAVYVGFRCAYKG